MKYYGKKSLSKVLDVALNITIILGGLLTVALFFNTFYKKPVEFKLSEQIVVMMLLVIGISCLFLIVFELKRIIKTLVKGDPFVRENVLAFKRISIESFTISVCYFINLIFNSNFKFFKFIYVDEKGIHTDMEFLIFFFAGVFIFILAKVFEQAVQFKEDNDLTI